MPTNPLDAVAQGGGGSPAAPTSPQSEAPVQSNPLDAVATSGGTGGFVSSNPLDTAAKNPLDAAASGNVVQKTDNQAPANEGILDKTWRILNTPLSESFGLPDSREGAGGLERGAEKVLSGFTSPLSLLLSIGTLGTGGFLESAGSSVLKDVLTAGAEGLTDAQAADKVAQFGKAAEAATNAFKTTGQNVAKAVQASGMDYNEFRSLQNVLYRSGLRESDLLGGNITERGISSGFRNLGVDAVKAQKIAKGTQFLMNTGFTAQQLDTAVHTVPQVFDALKDGRYDDAAEYMVEGGASGALGLLGASHALSTAGETFGSVNEFDKLKPTVENQKMNDFLGKREGRIQIANQTAKNFEEDVRADMGKKLGLSSIFETKGDKEVFDAKSRKLLVALDTGNDPELARQTGNALADAIEQPERKLDAPAGITPSQHPGLPENLEELVANAKFDPKQVDYISKFIDAYHDVANGLTDDEKSVYDRLRDQDDKNWNIGNTMGLINSHVENHIHHVWGDDTDVGNKLIQEARTGKFETSVTQARKRLWDTYAEGLLRGRQLVVDDPVAIIGHDYSNIYKAAANRAFIDTLRSSGTRASDGRPLTVLSGEAHAVQGPDGENPAVMINPNRVRDIRIAQNMVEQMKKTGDMDRFLDRGDILDITPRVRPDNIDAFIDRFEKQGISQEAKYDPEGSNILRKNIDILQKVKRGELPASALDEINAQQRESYVWHPQDYVTPANRTLHGWNWLTKTDDGTNILARSDIKFHPEVADYLINRLGLDQSYLREDKGIGKLTKPLLEKGKEAKAILLSFSPFHLQQEALRAVMMGVNPIRPDVVGEIRNRPAVARAVREGLTLAPDKAALEDHSAGVAQHSKLLGKIPVLGKAMDWYQDFLFNRYIPSLKAQATEVMYDKYQKAHPEWTDKAVAKATAQHVNNAFGGQNWRAMGRAAATQDWFHLFALAPDWLESEMRFAGSTLRGGLGNRNFSREQVAKMAAGLWGVARVANLVNSGNMHLESPFGLATKDKDGKEVIYSMRTLPTDILHMASDPSGFIKGRLSPFARLSQEAISGHDTFGRKLAPGDLAIDIARNMAPLPFQAVGQVASGTSPGVGNMGQVAKASGFTANVYRTEAEKLSAQLSSERNENGEPLDPQKLARYQAISRLEDSIRSGTMTKDDLHDAKDFGDLTKEEHKKILDNLKLTQGLDPETARLVSRVSRLPVDDALKIWDAATPREKASLSKVMVQKKNRYVMKANKEMSPQQRFNDPVFRRIRLLFPQEEEKP